MDTGWIDDNGTWYFADMINGNILVNTTSPDGYVLDAAGKWTGETKSARVNDWINLNGDGKTVAFALSSNPSTGYAWDTAVSDPEIIRSVGEKYVNPSLGTALAGAAGTLRGYFEAAGKPGTAVITMQYRRSEGAPAQTRTITVTSDGSRLTVSDSSVLDGI